MSLSAVLGDDTRTICLCEYRKQPRIGRATFQNQLCTPLNLESPAESQIIKKENQSS